MKDKVICPNCKSVMDFRIEEYRIGSEIIRTKIYNCPNCKFNFKE